MTSRLLIGIRHADGGIVCAYSDVMQVIEVVVITEQSSVHSCCLWQVSLPHV